jgi:hypothetical protein
MLEQLFSLVKEESQQEIINNPAIPNEFNNQAVGLATESIFGGLQSALSNGGLKDVLGMFSGNSTPDTNNGLVGGMTNNLVKSLMTKFGIDSPIAQSIAASVIPSVIGKLVSKTNDPSDSSFDINGIIGSLVGGGTSNGAPVQLPGLESQTAGSNGIDFGGILKSMTSGGMDANNDGSIGLDDLAGMVSRATSGSQQQGQAQPQGGGMLDMLKGLMGN